MYRRPVHVFQSTPTSSTKACSSLDQVIVPGNHGTFSNPASESLFSRLPAELATEIFGLATLNCRLDAASCRLVCQHFHIHSSPFLVRTIVIAARLEALRKVRDILLHPYFSKHVTHLLWDASFYSREFALQRESYEREFARESHTRDLRDPAVRFVREADELLEDQLRRSATKAPRMSPQTSDDKHLLDYTVSAPVVEESTSGVSQESQGSPAQRKAVGRSVLHQQQDVRHYIQLEDSMLQGLDSSCFDYHRRWLNQEDIYTKRVDPARVDSKHLDVDWNLARHFFIRAIDELPLLSHVSYGDFKSLAFEGESYKELCERLFGRTVTPSLDFFHSSYDDPALPQILADLVERRRSWLTLSTGRHPFERSFIDADVEDSRQCNSLKEIMEMRCDLSKNLECLKRSELQVRSLRLPVTGNEMATKQETGGLGRIVGAGLVKLDIGSRAFRHLRGFTNPENLESALAGWLWHPLSLSKLDLTALRSVSLHGFAFDTTTFHKLLSNCAPTLRTTRLDDCYCCGTNEAFSIFAANEVPQIIKLTGVEIYGLRFKDSILTRREQFKNRNNSTYRAMRFQEQIWGSETAGMRSLRPRIWIACELEEKSRSEGVDLISGWP